jgi:replicative superfamily II helicase
MVDFNKLRSKNITIKNIDPMEIFRRLPKPQGINDLYSSQADVLKSWFNRKAEKDIVLKLHTGGGKTLVGLLIALSSMNELKKPTLYLTPTNQLVLQTLQKANELGINAVQYSKGESLHDDFLSAKAIMVSSYKALFNGKSKFGVGNTKVPIDLGCIILDDAHTSFSIIRDSFSLEVKAENDREKYENIAALFRPAFAEIDRLGTFDDIISGNESAVLEIPYWSWKEKTEVMRQYLSDNSEISWPLIRDHLDFCHGLLSKKSITITPYLPVVHLFPSFSDCPRRIYMSATIADDSEIIKTFDADIKSVLEPLTSNSLAGVSERMILMPNLMPFEFSLKDIDDFSKWTTEMNSGVLILVSSSEKSKVYSDIGTIPENTDEVKSSVENLQSGKFFGPLVLANRYDGIDLPGNACRLLVLSGLPVGTSNYELFRASILNGGIAILRMIAQRIEQGIGRGARGSGDFCVVIIFGTDISSWISTEANFSYLTSPTKTQIEIGLRISEEIKTIEELKDTINRSYTRDKDWVEYHVETLAEYIQEYSVDTQSYHLARNERKIFNLWIDGYHEKAITTLERYMLENGNCIDKKNKGWLLQLGARIALFWGNNDKSIELQKMAFAENRSLFRPKILPPYKPLIVTSRQSQKIVENICRYKMRLGYINYFDEITLKLVPESSANQFEQSLCELGKIIGFESQRHDDNGEGPDVLWILPNNIGFVIETKSRKAGKNSFTKTEHGQLLVAKEWFRKNYPGFKCVAISVHPTYSSTKAASAEDTYVLTYNKLAELISDVKILLSKLCDSQLSQENLVIECENLLNLSKLSIESFVNSYLEYFRVVNRDS